jgi:hypothetical protein
VHGPGAGPDAAPSILQATNGILFIRIYDSDFVAIAERELATGLRSALLRDTHFPNHQMKTLPPLLLALGLAATSPAATLIFSANMDGLQEVPAVVTTGVGSATMTIDDSTGVWSLTGTFANLVGTTSNAHIHGPAPVGTSAGVVKGLTFDAGVTSGSLSGSNTLTGVYSAAQIADLINGLHYVNLHSTFRQGGEIRGQLLQVPEPVTAILASVSCLGLLRRRRQSA